MFGCGEALQERRPSVAARDPIIRHLVAVTAGNTFAARQTQQQHDETMARARAALLDKLRTEIDPDGTLAASDPAELDRRVDHLRRAKLAEASLKGVRARQEKARARRESEAEAELDALLADDGGAA